MVDIKEIEKLQIDKEKSNRELAECLGISHQALLRKKCGKIRWSLEDIEKLCDIFEIVDPARKGQIFLS